MTPLVLITGFLGSGKTSLLRTILPGLREWGLRPHVILNDYVNADVDVASLRPYVEDIQPLTSSCLCCGSMEALLTGLSDMELTDRDVVLIETHGTTDPLRLIESLLVLPIGRRFGAILQVQVVDCLRWQTRAYRNELERNQTRSASHGIYTWCKNISRSREIQVRTQVRGLNPRLKETDHDKLAKELADLTTIPDNHFSPTFVSIFETRGLPHHVSEPPQVQSRHRFDVGHHNLKKVALENSPHAIAHRFTAMQLELPRQLRASSLRRWMGSLPANVIRAKGIVEFDEAPGIFQLFQRVEDSVTFEEYPGEPPDNVTIAFLVGIELNEEGLRRDAHEILEGKPFASNPYPDLIQLSQTSDAQSVNPHHRMPG